jgi:hypothetical protein
MTYWRGLAFAEYDSMYSAINRCNRAFAAPLDTASWLANGQHKVNGTISLSAVPFLGVGTTPPITLTRTTDVTGSEEAEFDGEEFEEGGAPVAARVYQNYPNPFNPSTTLCFALRAQSLVTITVYDVLGREVATLLRDEGLDEGEQSVEFTAAQLASGMYPYRIDATDVADGSIHTIETRKMLLMK